MADSLEIRPIAYFHSPFSSKFGIPKQSGLVDELEGEIVFEPEYRTVDALRGIDGFDYIWLIWGFSANRHDANGLVVRPPLLGGNEKRGVFATRSPFRPNPIGLSSVRISGIDWHTARGSVIHVQGADLMDGTPIYDIKPYLPYADSHEGVRGGFTDSHTLQRLEVEIPKEMSQGFTLRQLAALRKTLELDPRPHYHHDSEKVYGMPFLGVDVRFRVDGNKLRVVECIRRG